MAIKHVITAAVFAALVCAFPLIAQGEDNVPILCLDQASCDAGSDDSPPATPDETEKPGEEVVAEEDANEEPLPQAAPPSSPAPVPTPAPKQETAVPAVSPAVTAPALPREPPDVCANHPGMKNLPEGWTRSDGGNCNPPPPRAGYCDPKTGKFYDLVIGQDKQEPYASMGLIDAYADPVSGSISCDFPKPQEKAPSVSPQAAVPSSVSRLSKPTSPPPPEPIPAPPAVKTRPASEIQPILPPPSVPPAP